MAHRWNHANRNSPAAQARQRDYNSPAHKAARRSGQAQVDAGHAHCWRCGKPIPPGSVWHVGHDDQRRIRGTECVKCNLTEAARKGNRIANQRRQAAARRAQSRVW